MTRGARTIGALVALVLLLAACDVGVSPSASGGDAESGPDLSLESAEEIARDFLANWAEGDYDAMYALVSPNTQERITADEFAGEYENVQEQLTLDDLTVTVTEAGQQGTTALIAYDVVFQTSFFGEISDPARLMRLIPAPEGWRIAWTRMDIFDRLAPGARLERRSVQPARGNIYDRNGDVIVQDNARSVLLWATQDSMPNVDDCISLLSRILRRETADVARQFALYQSETLFLAGELDEDIYQRESSALLQVCDVGDDEIDTTVREGRRYYNELAPHIVGYVGQITSEQLDDYTARGYPQDAVVGQAGIERTFEEELAGKIGGELVIVSPTGDLLRKIAETPSAPGQDVYLTLDRDLQGGVQDILRMAYNLSQDTWAPDSPGAAAVVFDVKTGDVLASASYPSFAPGLFNPDAAVNDPTAEISALRNDSRRPMFNRPLQGQYSPGSVFKIITMAAGLDSGVYDIDTTYTCDGTWSNPADVLEFRTDWSYPDGHGTINFEQALTYSCDPYFWELGLNLHQIDPTIITTHATEMGLGVPTGQTVVPEETGSIPNPRTYRTQDGSAWQLGDTINIAIGQGNIVVTPIQMVRMTAAIANGGTLWMPRFVQKVQPPGGEPTLVTQPEATAQLDYDPSVFESIRDAMCQVTLDDDGTARFIFEEWYDYFETDIIVCGKTGTAQTGGEDTPPNAWFTAFVPADNPQIAITVIVENSCEGSEVAAPITRAIIEDYFGLPRTEWPSLWQTGCIPLGE